MKKIISILTVLFLCLTVLAQETKNESKGSANTTINKHELKIGAVKPIVYQAVEFTYEYVASTKFGFGTSILFNTDKTNSYQEDFSLTPFVRFYFQDPAKQSGNGLFLEGFGKYISGRYEGLNDVDVLYNSTSIGVGTGYKWILKSGIIIEPLLGFSKTLAPKDSAAPGGGMRADIAFGYRF